MYKSLVIIPLVILLGIAGFCQTGIQWKKSYGGLRNDIPRSIIVNQDGSYVIVGSSESGNDQDTFDVKSNFGGMDFWAMKISLDGSLKWQQHYGGSQNDIANQAIKLSDGGIVISGYSFSLNGDVSGHSPLVTNSQNEVIANADYWVVKINSEGAIEWEKALGGSYIDECLSMIETSDHHLMLAGFSASNNGSVMGNHGGFDDWIVKMDLYGNVIWKKTYGGSGDDRATDIIECDDGGFLVTGFSNSSDQDIPENFGLYDFCLLRLDAEGSVLWKKSFGGSLDDRASSAVQTNDKGFAIAGFTWSGNSYVNQVFGEQDGWLIKIDSLGNMQWEKTFGGSQNDILNKLLLMPDGGFLLAGTSYSSDGTVAENNGSSDGWLTKTDDHGVMQWTRCFGGNLNEELNDLKATNDGGYILALSSDSHDTRVEGNHGKNDFWIVKLSPSVNIQPIESEKSTMSFFPNPANGKITITGFKSNIGSEAVHVSINDMMGRNMYRKCIPANVTENELIDISFLQNGVYSVQFSSNENAYVQKLLIQK